MVRGPVALGGAVSGPGPRVVCTLGMHRSGTSLVSRMLNLLGVALGPDGPISRTGADNPKGYWEHQSIVDINDAILARFGGRWDQPPAFPAAWPRDARLDDLRREAQRLLARDFAAEPLWGWKDPRTCVTLPFWQDVVGPMHYVICVRNPRAVMASLTHRNGIGAEAAEGLWLTHVQASLEHTSGQPRLFVGYEDLLEDWAPELRRLAAFLGEPRRAEDPAVQRAVAEFLEGEMCHHRTSPRELGADAAVSYSTKAIYLAVAAQAAPRRGTLEVLGAQGLVAKARTESLLAERAHLARETQAQAAAIAGLKAELRTVIAERDQQMRETEAALAVLHEVQASSAWRLATLARRGIARALPPGTRRRELFNAVLWRVARRLPASRARRAVAGPRTA
jgi:O-antigen biosynthesis protein